jgi:hypothetical protein
LLSEGSRAEDDPRSASMSPATATVRSPPAINQVRGLRGTALQLTGGLGLRVRRVARRRPSANIPASLPGGTICHSPPSNNGAEKRCPRCRDEPPGNRVGTLLTERITCPGFGSSSSSLLCWPSLASLVGDASPGRRTPKRSSGRRHRRDGRGRGGGHRCPHRVIYLLPRGGGRPR